MGYLDAAEGLSYNTSMVPASGGLGEALEQHGPSDQNQRLQYQSPSSAPPVRVRVRVRVSAHTLKLLVPLLPPLSLPRTHLLQSITQLKFEQLRIGKVEGFSLR